MTDNHRSLIISDLEGNPFKWVRGIYTLNAVNPSFMGRRSFIPEKIIDIYEPDFPSLIEDLLSMPLGEENEFIKALRRFYKHHGPLGVHLFEMSDRVQDFLLQSAYKHELTDKSTARERWMIFSGVSDVYRSVDDLEWWSKYRESIGLLRWRINEFKKVVGRMVFDGDNYPALKLTVRLINGRLVCPVQSLLEGIYTYLIWQRYEGIDLRACKGLWQKDIHCSSCQYGKLYFWNTDKRQEWGNKKCDKYAKVRQGLSRQKNKALELHCQGIGIEEIVDTLNKGKYKVLRQDVEGWIE